MTDHRALGVELNNAVWARLDAGDVTSSSPAEEREGSLYAAYASTHHWLQVGTVANHARGEHLIARVAAQVGLADLALRHATRCLELVESHPDDMEDWDMAFALEALARAQAGMGDDVTARTTLDRARRAIAAVADPGDRGVLEAQFDTGEWFHLLG